MIDFHAAKSTRHCPDSIPLELWTGQKNAPSFSLVSFSAYFGIYRVSTLWPHLCFSFSGYPHKTLHQTFLAYKKTLTIPVTDSYISNEFLRLSHTSKHFSKQIERRVTPVHLARFAIGRQDNSTFQLTEIIVHLNDPTRSWVDRNHRLKLWTTLHTETNKTQYIQRDFISRKKSSFI